MSEFYQKYILKHKRTKKGLIGIIYTQQVQRSKRKNRNKPDYSLKELREWVYKQDVFNILFTNWVDSNYSTDLIPSLDRIKPSLPYTLNNLQIIIWKENNEKGKLEKSNGRKSNEIVQSINLKTSEVLEFNNYREASKLTGDSIATISLCINNSRNSRKYSWKIITKNQTNGDSK